LILQGNVALVSGGLGDIGRAIALELAGRGADVAVSDILPPERAHGLLEEIRALGRKARYDGVDVGDPHAVRKWIADVERDLGTATLIVPNAAIVASANCREITPDDWMRHIRVNLDGAFFMAQAAALKIVAAKKAGRIVFVGSWAAHAAHPLIPAYCASKAGLRMLMHCMALEFAKDGILVNEVAPGYVDAGLSAKLFQQNPGAREKARERVPTRQLITAHDVAVQVAWLCDPQNSHMTGSVALLDGGLSLRAGM